MGLASPVWLEAARLKRRSRVECCAAGGAVRLPDHQSGFSPVLPSIRLQSDTAILLAAILPDRTGQCQVTPLSGVAD
jgi:hypothetical protein